MSGLQGRYPSVNERQVASSVLDLLKNPHPNYSKALKESSYYRLAVGEYRVIYEVTDNTILVAAIGKRNDGSVYQFLKR